MCLGGHLAFRCALDPRVSSAICYFATGKLYSLCKGFPRVSEEFGLIRVYENTTDIHSSTLGLGKSDDTLARIPEIKGELAMVGLSSS